MKDLLITHALDENNNLTHITNASRTHSYICTECKCKLTIRESKRCPDEKNYRRTHFAHTSNQVKRDFVCKPETILHNQYKRGLVSYLEKQLNDQQPVYLNWICNNCKYESSYDILNNIYFIQLEHSLKNCKPDIVLSTKDNEIKVVIEVVVTHYPDESVLDIYKKNKYFVVIIKLNTSNDLDDIGNSFHSKAKTLTYNNPHCCYCKYPQKDKMFNNQALLSQINEVKHTEHINAVKTKNIADHKFLCPKCRATILKACSYQKYTEFKCDNCDGYLYIPLSNIVMNSKGEIIDIIDDKKLCLNVNIYKIWLTNPNQK